VQFDYRLARSTSFSQSKVVTLAEKYVALARIGAHRDGVLRIDGRPFVVDSISAVGSLQACIVDIADEIVASHILPERPSVVDVGANIGQFCAAFKLFFPLAHIVSIEADPATYERLVRNTGTIPGVSNVCAAVGEATGTRTFFRHALSVMSSFTPYESQRYEPDATIELRVDRLDDVLVPNADRIDLLKLDVEGFEGPVLRGAKETLQRTHYLLLELGLGRTKPGSTNLEVLTWIYSEIPGASILRMGRLLGTPDMPLGQDILLNLHPEWN
jgi:FkbM family methyltransferase